MGEIFGSSEFRGLSSALDRIVQSSLGKTLRPRNPSFFEMFNQEKTSMMEFRECFVNWRTQNKFYKNAFLDISYVIFDPMRCDLLIFLAVFRQAAWPGDIVWTAVFSIRAPSCNKRGVLLLCSDCCYISSKWLLFHLTVPALLCFAVCCFSNFGHIWLWL